MSLKSCTLLSVAWRDSWATWWKWYQWSTKGSPEFIVEKGVLSPVALREIGPPKNASTAIRQGKLFSFKYMCSWRASLSQGILSRVACLLWLSTALDGTYYLIFLVIAALNHINACLSYCKTPSSCIWDDHIYAYRLCGCMRIGRGIFLGVLVI